MLSKIQLKSAERAVLYDVKLIVSNFSSAQGNAPKEPRQTKARESHRTESRKQTDPGWEKPEKLSKHFCRKEKYHFLHGQQHNF